MTGFLIFAMVIVFAELAVRDNLSPLRTLGGAASGQLVLKK